MCEEQNNLTTSDVTSYAVVADQTPSNFVVFTSNADNSEILRITDEGVFIRGEKVTTVDAELSKRFKEAIEEWLVGYGR